MTYLLDTNIFIEPAKRYFQHDLCPSYWEWLEQIIKDSKAKTISQVTDELAFKKSDEDDFARQWVDQRKHILTIDDVDTDDYTEKAQQLSVWSNDKFGAKDAADFMKGADYHLVVCAMVAKYTVVTSETTGPVRIGAQIKIPTACKVFGVKCINHFDMLRELKVRLAIESAS